VQPHHGVVRTLSACAHSTGARNCWPRAVSAADGRPVKEGRRAMTREDVDPVNKIGDVADFEGIKANIPFVPLGLRNEETEDVHARAAALLGL
jgi:hypothetical protein